MDQAEIESLEQIDEMVEGVIPGRLIDYGVMVLLGLLVIMIVIASVRIFF